MYKHSHIKRDDGDHINIWVDRRFADKVEDDGEDEQDLSKRQGIRLADNVDFQGNDHPDWCTDHTRDDKTGPNAPYTGGLNAMFRWADTNKGFFHITDGGPWQNLVIAGSNTGANTLYRVQAVDPSDTFHVGLKDIRNDVDWTRNKRRKFGSSWRASSTGRESCSYHRIRYQVIRTKYDV